MISNFNITCNFSIIVLENRVIQDCFLPRDKVLIGYFCYYPKVVCNNFFLKFLIN